MKHLKFNRPVTVPAEVEQRLHLAHGKKPLAAAVDGDGSWVVGTSDALLVLGVADESATRLPWEQVQSADWDEDKEQLRVMEVGEFGQPRTTYNFVLAEPGRLLELVRERVTASVVLQRRVEVSGKRGLSVIARRAPAGAGEITWAYELDQGIDPDDPKVRAAAEAGLREATDELGL